MSDFQDREVRDQLQRMSGHGPDSAEAYARLQIGVRRARRRQAVSVLTGLGVTVVLAFSAAAYASRSHSKVTPADGGTDSAITTGNSELTTDTPEPDDSVTVSAPQTSDGDGTSGSQGTQKPGTSSGNQTPSVPTSDDGPNNQPPTEPTDAESPHVDETKTGVSSGGSITVSLHQGVLTLTSYTANGGYSHQIEDPGPDRIRVRFENSNGQSRIEATIADDGHISFEVSESYSGSDNTSEPTSP